MSTISKERRDEIRAAAVGVTDTWPPASFERGNLKTRTHIANCDPQTILALLDALDAAEKADTLPYSRVIEIVAECSERMKAGGESHRMFAKWVSEGVNAALYASYTHPAPAVREGWKPTHWALYSVSGSHIGLWTDETWVERLQAQYPGSTILPPSAAPEAK